MKYCPNCNFEYKDDVSFCGKCGTKLVEASTDTGVGIHLGNGNAVNGGIHLMDSHNISNDSHNVSNFDQRVFNHITQVERPQTEAELLQERKIQFNAIIDDVFADGILEQEEEQLLEKERLRIGLDEVTAKRLIETARKEIPIRTRQKSLGGPAALMMKQIVRFMHNDQQEMLRRLLPSLESLARNSLVDDVQYRYHLALAVLDPDKLISKYEETLSDNYWRSFWACVTYMNKGRFDKVVDISFELSRFTAYSEENITLLSAFGAMKEFDEEEARDIYGTVTGMYSKVLSGFAGALLLTLEPEKAKENNVMADDCKFYLKNFFKRTNNETSESPQPEPRQKKSATLPEEDRSFIVGRYGRQRDEIFDRTVSREHCRVTLLDSGMVEVKNLSRSNSLYINGKKTEIAEVSMDSVLKMGNCFVIIRDLFPPRKTPSGPGKDLTK